jgi:hypothetical protein
MAGPRKDLFNRILVGDVDEKFFLCSGGIEGDGSIEIRTKEDETLLVEDVAIMRLSFACISNRSGESRDISHDDPEFAQVVIFDVTVQCYLCGRRMSLFVENLPLETVSRKVTPSPRTKHLLEATIDRKEVGERLTDKHLGSCKSTIVGEASAGLKAPRRNGIESLGK